MKRAPELALVDACVNRARQITMTRLAAQRARRRPPLPGAPGSKLARAIARRRMTRVERFEQRDDATWSNANELARQPGGLKQLDDIFAAGKVKAKRFQKDARIRAITAAVYRADAAEYDRPDIERRARKLENAGRMAYLGARPDGSLVVRLRDRSGLIKDDPAESRERTAELIERLMPVLLECAKHGLELYSFVFTEPNIPAGALRWHKAQLFRDFTRRILERDSKGQEIPRTLAIKHHGRTFDVDNPARKFPEIVAAFAVQEDPLSANCYHWNTHLNVLLVVDPGQCSPLDEELWPDDPARPGERKRDPARDFAGMFSFMKLRHVWGNNVHCRRLEPNLVALRAALLEIIKYSCKTVSEKSLEKFEQRTAPPGMGADPEKISGPGHVEANAAAASITPALELVVQDAADRADPQRPPAPLELICQEVENAFVLEEEPSDDQTFAGNAAASGNRRQAQSRDRRDLSDRCTRQPIAGGPDEEIQAGARRGSAQETQKRYAGVRPPAPALDAWPSARRIEWIDANDGFRRVRAWGCLYRLGKIPRATDPDEGIRWLGRLWIDPWKITVQMTFLADYVDSIRENKSSLSAPRPKGQAPPRAGPVPAL